MHTAAAIDYDVDDELLAKINPALDYIASLYGEGEFIRIMLANVPARKEVLQHIDSAASFGYAHRIHLPVETNPRVVFTVTSPEGDATVIPFEAGKVVEINNRWNHEVKNRSGRDRVHLIVDFMPTEHVGSYRVR